MADGTQRSGISTTSGLQEAPAVAANPAPSAAQPQVSLDDAHAVTSYANFARVTGTPEELIIDVGLNTQPFGVPTHPVKVDQRIVLGFHTAKRLLAALHMTMQRHEQAFGVLELDVQRRASSATRNVQ